MDRLSMQSRMTAPLIVRSADDMRAGWQEVVLMPNDSASKRRTCCSPK
jgi:hypothetical protein